MIPGDGTERPARHLVLVGLPGSGKSTVGRRVAEQLGRPFIDFDTEIERRAGQTVAQLFTSSGEAAFRKAELELTKELVDAPASVLAPGGGWAAIEPAVRLLRPRARFVWLRVSPETAIARLRTHAVRRPLLDVPDPLGRLRELAAARAAAYAAADFAIDTEVDDMQRVVHEVLAYARDACRVVDPHL